MNRPKWFPKLRPAQPTTAEDSAKNQATSAPPAGSDRASTPSQPSVDGSRPLGQTPPGESEAMSALADTLENTRAFDEDQADRPPSRVQMSSRFSDNQRMNFTYASGSKPLQGYTIKRGVGVGGFGEVYFAVSDAGKEVALKRVQRNLDIELRGVSHCLNLKHPNLISLYDIRYDDAGQAWVVMEYVSGASLRDALDQTPHGMSEAEVRRWFSAIAAGVAHLHDAGIVHRDLKPGNIFDDDGIVKIGDYGLSKYISCSRRGGHTESVGTFHYMAPEIGRGNYGREIDIYALGIMLFEMLTGDVPFDGESSHEIVMKHLTDNPDLSGVAEPYRGVIWQALQKNPASRQQSVPQMLRPLGIELDGHGLARAIHGNLSDPAHPSAPHQPHSPASQQAGHPHMGGQAGIQFDPPPATRRPGDAGPRPHAFVSAQREASPEASGEVRFGEVRHHRPSPVPLAGATPHQAHATGGGNQEPLARAVRSTAADLKRWWASLEPFPGTRLVLAVMGVILLVINTQWLLPLLTLLAIVYVPYYVIRSIVVGSSSTTSHPAVHYPPVPRVLTAKQWREQKRVELAGKTSGTRLAELGGSTSTAAVGAAVMASAAAAFSLWNEPVSATDLAPFAWSATLAATASAVILLFGKLWEREEGSSWGRRSVMLGAGAAVGAAGYALADYLMLPMADGLGRDIAETTLPPALYDAGTPMLAALMAHFAVLFGGLRWWRVADPLRRRRMSLWAVAVAVVAEWALHQVLPIPQPWGMITAGMAAIAVQIAAPWENPKQRFQTNPSVQTA